ncbi:MAG: aspartate aminotransferase family protein [Spirochaetes bacterium]|nr:MAG: aspartate aminotransferase family protein [Spirochaetota bacterium]
MMSVQDDIKKSINEVYESRTKKSKETAAIAEKYIPSGDTRAFSYFPPYPIYGDEGEGCYLIDNDGNRYIDFLNCMTAGIYGHAHPVIVKAQIAQVKKGIAHALPCDSQYQLAKIICDRVPSVEKVRFTNTGSEADLFAMRVARAYTGRDIILKMDGGYHGSSEYAQVNEIPDIFTSNPPQAYISSKGVPDVILQNMRDVDFMDLDAAEEVMKAEGKKIAAIIVEPVMGAGCGGEGSYEYLHGLRDLCDKYGALLIFDEVISFRFSMGGKQKLVDVQPDMTTFGKLIGGGMPIGAIGGRADVMRLFDPRVEGYVNQSGTFTGNALSMTSGVAAMQLLSEQELKRIDSLAAKLAETVNKKIKDLGINAYAEALGSMMAIYGTREKIENSRMAIKAMVNNGEFLRFLHLELLNNGLVCLSRGMFSLSLPMDDKIIKEAGGIICNALEVVASLCVE